MRYHTHQVSAGTVERVERNGREYLSFPLVPLREMVLNYPEFGTDEYLPAESIERSAPAWAGVPLTYKHPPDRGNGQTARDPDAYTEEVFGRFHQPDTLNGGEKLRGTGHIDIEKARAIGGPAERVVERLNAGQEVAVSAGYGTLGDADTSGTFDGEPYDLEQGDLIPDHIAVFPPADFQARCDRQDGCGAPRVNAVRHSDQESDRHVDNTNDPDDVPESSTIRRVLNYLGRTNADHDHDCDCGGTCEDCTDGDDDGPGPDADGADDGTDGESSADDGTDASGDSTDDDQSEASDSMSDDEPDERVAELAEETPFDQDTLEDMTDEQLAAISPASAGDDGGADDDEAEVVTNTDDGTDADALREEVEALRETVESLQAEKANAEKRGDARIVANALDIEVEDAMEMDGERLNSLAEKYGDRADTEPEPRTNFSAVPGSVDRTVDDGGEQDFDHISAGTRSDYEARQEGDD